MSQLLFVPGLLCTSAIFDEQVRALGDLTTCHMADTTNADTITQMAERALDQMDGQFALLGFSMGGYVALEMMRLAPERITGLALVSTSAKPDTQEKRHARQELINLSKIGKFKGVTPRLLPRFFSADALKDEAKTRIVLEMGAQIGQANFMSQQQAIMSRRDQRDTLPLITQKSIVICGTEDVLTPPAESEEMARLLPNAQLVLLDGIAHMATMEAPDTISDLLRDWYRALDS